MLPRLARLEIGRKRLAARLHRLGDVHRERFGVEGVRSLGFSVDVAHIKDTTASFRVRHRVDWRHARWVNPVALR